MPFITLNQEYQGTEGTRSHPEMVSDMLRVTATSASRPVQLISISLIKAPPVAMATLFTK